MTIPGGTTRASQPKALMKDKHSHGVGGEKVMKKGGEGPHNWGGPASELEDELAAQQDAQREAEEAIAEGEDIPGVQSFADRVTGGVSGGPDTGSLAQEFADKEGAYIVRQTTDPKNMDLNEIARTSGATSHPTGDAVSSGANASLEASVDAIQRSKGTEGGFAGNLGTEQEIVRDATTANR